MYTYTHMCMYIYIYISISTCVRENMNMLFVIWVCPTEASPHVHACILSPAQLGQGDLKAMEREKERVHESIVASVTYIISTSMHHYLVSVMLLAR